MNRLLQVLKITWMGYWRLLFILPVVTLQGTHSSSILIIALVLSVMIAVGVVYFMNRSILVAPLWKLIRHQKSPILDLGARKFRKRRYSKNTPQNVPEGYINSATKPGRMSGYEPNRLSTITLEPSPIMYGNPGGGLKDSGFSQKHIDLGVQGELNFAKVLQHENMLTRFATAWSTRMPDKTMSSVKDSNYTGDLDCLIVTGGATYLIDLKNYASGDVTYYANDSQIFAVDNATNKYLSKGAQKMSANMSIFYERYHSAYPSQKIRPYIVLMPTDKGEATIHPNVRFPGDIPVITLTQLLEILRKEPPFRDSGTRGKIFRNAGYLTSL